MCFYVTVHAGEASVIDKQVAAHSDVFLAAESECGGRKSFEHDILRFRRRLGRTDPHVLRWGAKL